MIDVEHLTKFYGQRAAVDDVSFQVGRGEIVGFLGPNGAGKTTTMRMLTTFLPPSSGTARVAGRDILRQSMDVRRAIGYLPEHPPLYPEMTVTEYLVFVATLKEIPGPKRVGAVGRSIERARLADVRQRLVGNLSKGFRQRVGLAQALLTDPAVLILDEPTIGLDPNQIQEVRALIRGLAGEHTVILSTHILSEVEATCQRVVIIDRGRIVATDRIDRLRLAQTHVDRIRLRVARDEPAVARVLGALPGVQGVQRDDTAAASYVVEAPVGGDLRELIARTVVEEGWGLLELARLDVSLEEVFARLTADRAAPGPGGAA